MSLRMRRGSVGAYFILMNEIIRINAEQTMSSLQIAELTKKRHDAILRDIRKLLEQGVTAHNFVASEYKDSTGRTLPCYNLTKTGCFILASGYNALLREKIISRWIELEKAAQLKVPTTFREALLFAAAQQEQIEKQQQEITLLSDKVETMQPKADYYDSILSSPDSVVVTQIAKDYGMSPQEFNKRLNTLGIQYKVNGQWVLRQIPGRRLHRQLHGMQAQQQRHMDGYGVDAERPSVPLHHAEGGECLSCHRTLSRLSTAADWQAEAY